MVQTLAVQTKEAGPSSFVTSQDFISFDDFDDDFGTDEKQDEEKKSASEKDPSDGKRSNEGDRKSRAKSPRANGKKRKTDDVVELEGKSKREKKREVARGTPWCANVDFDRCITAADVLHDEMMAFEHWISPTQREHETRKMVIQLIGRAINKQWPDADVRSFGSQNTQLYMPQGDIDLVVISSRMESQRQESVLRSLAACLRRNNLATDVQVISKAKVPIVKFVCTHGRYKVDISINHTNGIDASHFVKDWQRRCPAVRPLIMATKLLLSQRGMSEVFSGGLGSYSVICLVISFIQMHPKIQRGEIDPSKNLGVLFLELLELFGKNFGYDEVGISIAGRGNYFRKAARGWKDDRRPFMLSIEDPGDPNNDISKGSYGILNVRQTFGGAFDIMTAAMCQRPNRREEHPKKKKNKRKSSGKHRDEDEEAREALISSARLGESDKDPESLLGNIIGANREMVKARRDIEQLWSSGTLQYMLGRSPPPQEPLPYEPTKRSRQEEREPPRAPKAMRALEKDASSNGTSKRKPNDTTSRGNASGSIGSASSPVIIVDDSDNVAASSHKETKSNGHALLLPLDEEERPINAAEEDESEVDSRYANRFLDNRRQKKRSRLDDFSKEAPTEFVSDDSASEYQDDDDDDDDDESIEEGEAVDTPPKRRKIGSKEEEKKRRRREYWENKGNASADYEEN